MFSKIIFVLATVCVVNASVINVNVFDDDPDIEVASITKGCYFRACDQLWRRLKFPGGACVNGRCKCDNFLNAEDEVSKKTLSDLEDSILQIDDSEAEVAAIPSRCNLKVCDLVCRWLNKTSGSCVDSRCKCTKSLIAEDDPETEIENKKSDCNNQACNQLCRRLKFPGGACVHGRCKCDNLLNADDDMTDPAEFTSPGDCNFKACAQQCFRLGFPGGACVHGRCKCDTFLITEDDMTDPVEFLSPGDCNFRACDQQCRRLGFPGGACVNGRCKCDNFLNTEDTMTGPAESLPLSSCNSTACDDQCRRTGWLSGVCINGQCKCDYFLNTEDTMTEPAESLPLSSCNSTACDDQCRRTGWHSGVCINGQCKCDYFLNTEVSENSLSNLEDSVSPRKCTHQECNALCRKLKFREGVCIAGRCRCNNYFPAPKDKLNNLEESISLNDNFLSTEDEVSDESLPVSELSEDQTERGCNMRACDQLCRRLKFPGGACVNGRCKCDNFFGTEDAVDEYSKFAPKRVCRLAKCNRKCTHRDNEGATCVNGRCKCYNNLQEKDEISETSLPVSELSEDQTERGCNMRACDQLCRRLKFPGGACVNGRCKCDNFFGSEDAVDEYSELATRRICNLRQCNRTCTRRGYEGARCVNGWCKCHNKIQRQDTSLLNDVTNDEDEKSLLVLRTNEEELIEPSPSACNTVTCNQMCHHLNYAGGWCRFGQCQCY